MARLDKIIAVARDARASDVHITPGMPVRFRIDGQLVDMDATPLEANECESLAQHAVGEAFESISHEGEFDMAATFAGSIRCRLNIYHSDRGICLAIRLLAAQIPTMEELGLPRAMMDFPSYRRGIVLVTGETGSGKSTTLASIINEINHTRADHIITLEDPIEYVYESDRSLINQREVGRDTASFAQGLRAILREDPDVVLVGEMRDLDTIATALTAAETGHLVFATLHTQSAADSVDRLIDVFPEARQRQIRLQLSTTLKAVVSQQLLVRREGKGRCVACEIMIVNPAIRNLIREGKTPQIENTIATTAELGSITMDHMLVKMVRERLISRDVAISAARDAETIKRLIR
jgi:twitching motility protein PilT